MLRRNAYSKNNKMRSVRKRIVQLRIEPQETTCSTIINKLNAQYTYFRIENANFNNTLISKVHPDTGRLYFVEHRIAILAIFQWLALRKLSGNIIIKLSLM